MMILPNGVAVIEGDEWISHWVEQTGRLDHDVWIHERLAPYLHEGDTVVDIGANIGSHTISYLRMVGESGTVLAFEPNPEAFECLSHNCPRAKRYRIGLSDERGWAALVPCGENAGAMSLTETETGLVRLMPLDDFWVLDLKYAKIDAEGMELKILNGAKETIRTFKPVMCIEINVSALARQGATPSQVYEFLTAHGYSFSPIAPELNLESEQFDMLCRPNP